jgi:hypothetical protein
LAAAVEEPAFAMQEEMLGRTSEDLLALFDTAPSIAAIGELCRDGRVFLVDLFLNAFVMAVVGPRMAPDLRETPAWPRLPFLSLQHL